ncbi:SGNH/GDSL hydrolase family protein [Halorhabdus amylolytica]|uniref:hypothetical protein n=1 Tax=Halorhabdus amylolytica TaxID=2559573 RepID=UPI0010A9AFF9|nr:hypothetical protein [Halorhabdus amylolytica]
MGRRSLRGRPPIRTWDTSRLPPDSLASIRSPWGSGAAYCEPVIAEHIAGRADWNVATIAVSVNVTFSGLRGGACRWTPVDHYSGKPVVAVSLFPYHADIVAGDDPARAAAYRETLRTLVSDSSHENLSLIEGEKLLSVPGLMDDALHPGVAGMIEIGRNLATELAPLFE